MILKNINDKLSIVCQVVNTSNGFKHIATLLVNGCDIATAKVCYINRTWERKQFDTVIAKLASTKGLDKEQSETILNFIK